MSLKLPMLDADTANHAVYGGAIALVALLVSALLGRPQPELHAAVVVLLFAAGKEAADYLSRRAAAKAGDKPTHSVEWADLAGTVAGGLAIVGARLLG